VTYLVDATVLSEPTKPTPSEAVIEWLRLQTETGLRWAMLLAKLRDFGKSNADLRIA
jgi:hypothetical protein